MDFDGISFGLGFALAFFGRLAWDRWVATAVRSMLGHFM